MVDETRFFEWDFDHDQVVEYERQGECNGCGACCQVLIKFSYSQAVRNDIERYGLRWDPRNGMPTCVREGVVFEVRSGEKRRFYEKLNVTDQASRCMMLGADQRCRVHMGKHLLCSAWPMSPRQTAPFPECSYQFREIGRWAISDVIKAGELPAPIEAAAGR